MRLSVRLCCVLAMLLMVAFAHAQHPEAELVFRLSNSCGLCLPYASYEAEVYADGSVHYRTSSRYNKYSVDTTYFISRSQLDSLVRSLISRGIFDWPQSVHRLKRTEMRNGKIDTVVDLVTDRPLRSIVFYHADRSKSFPDAFNAGPEVFDLANKIEALLDVRQFWPGAMLRKR